MAEPQIRYCTSADGTRIAYVFSEEGRGPPLFFVNHVFFPIAALRFGVLGTSTLGAARQHLRLDRRGVGHSQRDVTDFRLDAQVADVFAVATQANLTRFDLMGVGDGCLVAAAFAARHQGRVRRLALSTPTPAGSNPAGRSVATMVRSNWALARGAMADITLGGNTNPGVRRAYIRLLAEIQSPETAISYLEADWDPGPELGSVTAPTLVIYPKRRLAGPIEVSQTLAAAIPGARFLAPNVTDVEYNAALREFFGDEDPVRESRSSSSGSAASVATILFTDIESNTELLQRLGDEHWRALLREHERITREQLVAHGGSEVKHTGDGFMASFGSAAKALDCAVALQRAFEAQNASSAHAFRVRIGVNAGEPIAEEHDLFGTAVTVAARVMAQARGGEVLVTDVVRQLVAGKGFLFADRGEAILRGFEDPVRVWQLRLVEAR